MKAKAPLILKATTLITALVLTSSFGLTQSAHAKGFDLFESVRQALDNSKPTPQPTKLQQLVEKASAEIDRRLTTLTHLNVTINSAARLSATNKAALQNEVNTVINSLNTLKSKLASDKTVTQAQADIRTIVNDYRVYALIVPKVHLIKLADDIQATDTKLSEIAVKLQTRIDAAKASGKDVSSIQDELTSLKAHVAAAQNVAGNVETKVIGLQPSDYNSDHKLLAGYSAQLRQARADDQAAYTDAKNIVNVLKSYSEN